MARHTVQPERNDRHPRRDERSTEVHEHRPIPNALVRLR
jgi:hypothetical protein